MQESATLSSQPSEEAFTLPVSTVVLILSVTFGFALTAALTLMHMASGIGGTSGDAVAKLILLVGTLAFIVPAWIWTKYTRKSFVSVFRFHPVPPATLISTLLLAVGLVIVTDAIDKAIAPVINSFLDGTIGLLSPELKSDKILERLSEEFKLRSIPGAVFLILAAVAAAGVCEEMLLRGMFQGALEKKMCAAWAVAISSFVFALIHFNPWGGIQIFILAVFLGVVAWRTQSIVPTVIMHGMNNLLAIAANNISPENLSWYGDEKQVQWYMLVTGLALTVFGIAGIFRWTEGRN